MEVNGTQASSASRFIPETEAVFSPILASCARDATFLKINEDRPGAPIFKGWTDNSFSMSTNFDGFRL
ncbi:hypothetical protein HIC89_002953 [Escherichia coli]|nr:hypothetical protein [Escherichia coli]EFB3572981.1 hypothetical protein [Escherichia coli]EFB9219124.1 hypothetical protein [Escherichia coli]EFI8725694.1 hypothetical protein [Escherichia coli]EFN9120514.1 hypothetical protein [Escherichia coli]